MQYLDSEGIAARHGLTVSDNEGSVVHLPHQFYGFFPRDVRLVPVGHQWANFALCEETQEHDQYTTASVYTLYNHIITLNIVEIMVVHVHCTCIYICRLMRRRIKVTDPRIFLVSAAYIHIREEVVDEYHIIMRTRRFACHEQTQSGGFAWLVVANRTLPYRSSSTIAICATGLPSARRLAYIQLNIPGDRAMSL